MSVLFECTFSQTILKTYIISYYTSSAWRLKERRLTSVFCISVNGEIQSRIGEENSFTSLIEACFKFKYPASLNPRITTISHLCAIEVALKLSTKLCGSPAVHRALVFYKKSTIPEIKWSKLSKTLKKYHTFVSFQNGRQGVTLTRKPLNKSAASSRFQFPWSCAWGRQLP